MWFVRAERECGLQENPIDRLQPAARHVRLVSCVELRELAGEELQIPRDCSRVRAVELRIFQEIESRAEETPPGDLIACECVTAGEISRRDCEYDFAPRCNDGFSDIVVSLLHLLVLTDYGVIVSTLLYATHNS